jgi:predicted aconitase with swiveling domain
MAQLTSFKGEPILEKAMRGVAYAADTPLSFWGGFDPDTGMIIDQRHPLAGQNASGQILVIPAGRGSCSGSGVILEAIVNHTAPAAILISRVDPIIALGCILGAELYDACPALLVIADDDRQLIRTGDEISISNTGWITIHRARSARPSEESFPRSRR